MFWFSRIVILFLLPLHLSDAGTSYLEYARNLLVDGNWPYRDFPFEYPPLVYPLFVLPAGAYQLLHRDSPEIYRLLFGGAFLLPFDWLLFAAFRDRPPVRGAAFAYVLLTGALAQLLFDRYDLLVGFCLAWPFLASLTSGNDAREPEDTVAVAWGIGAALKLVPILLFPVLIARRWPMAPRRFVRLALIAALPLLLSLGTAAALGKGKISFLSHHSSRGIQVESLAGSLLMGARLARWMPQLKVDDTFGAQHVAGLTWQAGAAHALFWIALAGTFAALLAGRRRLSLAASAWLMTLSFVTFGYVLSPQFLLWLVPLSLVVAAEIPPAARLRWLGLFGLVVFLTGMHFRFYWNYVELRPLSVIVVLLRNLGLLVLCGLSWKALLPRPGAVSKF